MINMLEMENRLNGSRIRYRCYEIRKQYLYAKCSYKGCRAQLRFKRKNSDNGYLICLDQRSHEHSKHKSSLHQNIEAFIQDLPLTIEISAAKQLTMDRFQIK